MHSAVAPCAQPDQRTAHWYGSLPRRLTARARARSRHGETHRPHRIGALHAEKGAWKPLRWTVRTSGGRPGRRIDIHSYTNSKAERLPGDAAPRRVQQVLNVVIHTGAHVSCKAIV